MSSTNVTSTMAPSQLAYSLLDLETSRRCAVAISALAMYDLILCLPDEMRLLWQWWPFPRMTLSTTMYLLCRMATFAWCIIVWVPARSYLVAADLRTTERVFTNIVNFFQYILPIAFGCMRIYAVTAHWHSRHRKSISVAASSVGLVPVLLNIIGYARESTILTTQPRLPNGTELFYETKMSLSSEVAFSIGFDLLVILILWIQCRAHLRLVHQANIGTSIVSLLVEESQSLTYRLSLALNVLDVILWRLYNYEWIIDNVLLPLTSILIARCLLHLKEADSALAWSSIGEQRSLEFAHPDREASHAPHNR
ncbi:uncharacterized protein B0H18DRAFT_994196 [Fomitopsis serialis]|uniref:uncharacterized protein n=1 Tax=Fomitopsis serialis TaxID=139415 RepID=UPI00200821E4|nr:uncharacterized protein B0H18DRAFT_994196 [Neoantrodia serialis]KAH9930288.1 hypothetical protein B0H18DRAFT_994196 [Neoantrodia serialis]